MEGRQTQHHSPWCGAAPLCGPEKYSPDSGPCARAHGLSRACAGFQPLPSTGQMPLCDEHSEEPTLSTWANWGAFAHMCAPNLYTRSVFGAWLLVLSAHSVRVQTHTHTHTHTEFTQHAQILFPHFPVSICHLHNKPLYLSSFLLSFLCKLPQHCQPSVQPTSSPSFWQWPSL